MPLIDGGQLTSQLLDDVMGGKREQKWKKESVGEGTNDREGYRCCDAGLHNGVFVCVCVRACFYMHMCASAYVCVCVCLSV